jgi:hypothetical protein
LLKASWLAKNKKRKENKQKTSSSNLRGCLFIRKGSN